MKIYRTRLNSIVENENSCYLIENTDWDELINQDDLYVKIQNIIENLQPLETKEILNSEKLLPPVNKQEIWAAGVTYLRSKAARMEESRESGGATFYDKVYEAERPELFFKATAHRTVGHKGFVNIRKDSTWDVPEPELTLFITSSGKIAGYTIGNDMSSRSIEGENPLYLPQAKVFDGCAGLGPCIYIPEDPISSETEIRMVILRENKSAFEGSIQINQMKRSHTELVDFLFRECSFPDGVFLMTGTCIVPGNDFTLRSKDEIQISIEGIGTLINYVS
ncbi:fumarylacetoacetate hydrolase family protein [Rubrolithibacter danxiaensis]|uniref:fumarylacetoacetate hydrolase family protein n=1 Tax=Rubrolithibacter danxiaensis TaxID=3390805 RepID=UPI003BF7A549